MVARCAFLEQTAYSSVALSYCSPIQVYRWNGENQVWQSVPAPFPILHVAAGSDREVWAIIDEEAGRSAKLSNVASWNGKEFVRVPGTRPVSTRS